MSIRLDRLMKGICAAPIAVALTASVSIAVRAAEPITAQEAHAIGIDAYLYFYPIISMDLTRKQLSNIEPGKGALGGPMNMFVSIATFPPADFKAVVRPNFDTLYSSAWLDMTKEPVVISVGLSTDGIGARPDGKR